MTSKKTIAIIGGGITGATAVQTLSKYNDVIIHIFDQGRRGVGGRTSSRSVELVEDSTDDTNNANTIMRWDHGCQFFRADTPQFQDIIKEWLAKDFVREWRGEFRSSSSLSKGREFFGLPSTPPFYVGWDGMQSIAQSVLNDASRRLSGSSASSTTTLRVFKGTRVAKLERGDDSTQQNNKPRWQLYGTSGMAAYHDTSEKFVQLNNNNDNGGNGMQLIGEESGYDAIILTDLSSSFGKWHRASAGVPEEFAQRVRERVGARVPLFAAMIAFDGKTNIPFDAASFDDEIIWFAARSNSKPGMGNEQKECWTIVSTPEYAMAKIEETPMQDPKTGEFIPQSKEYLTSVPGPDLLNAFKSLLRTNDDTLCGENSPCFELPEVIHIDAQRWGSALPSHRHLDDTLSTRKVISGVPYDSGRFPLAPTKVEREDGQQSFLVDESLMLYQAGDMVSNHTPGFEGAALSGYDAAEHLYKMLHSPKLSKHP